MSAEGEARVRAILANPVVLSDGRTAAGEPMIVSGPMTPSAAAAYLAEISATGAPPASDDEGEGPPSDVGGDPAIVRECASLDQSDTDNAKRLIAHFGRDIAVVARDGKPGGDWISWEGRFWDYAAGPSIVTRAAQKVGGRIAAEAEFLGLTPEERRAVAAAEAFSADDKSPIAVAARSTAKAAREALTRRKLARWRFAVSSKNSARIKSMLEMAQPLTRKPSADFNRDPLKFAARNATIAFRVEDDLDCPDPDVVRKVWREKVSEGHDREDLLTGLVGADYDPDARAEKFFAFLERCLPDPAVRRTLQAYSAMGLLGLLAQKLCFHYGAGANGKSVFLAVLAAVIGSSLGVSLPKETIMGTGERGAGQASPDLVRLFGKRFVRIDELKEGESVREDLVKRLTGGDTLVVRDLFQGYLEFPNVATPHMVGNGYPRIDGTDLGIWRRMLVIHWGVTIPESERKPFDAFVAELLTERAGILNWLVAGARDFLGSGLVVAEACAAATQEFREDMDPIGRFVEACVAATPGEKVQARVMYEAFKSWAMANAVAVFHESRFGRDMKRRFKRDDRGHTRAYCDVALHDVPARPDLPDTNERFL